MLLRILKHNDKNLVDGQGAFKVKEELDILEFTVHSKSAYICKSCIEKLKKRRGVINNLRNVEVNLLHHLKLPGQLNVKKKEKTIVWVDCSKRLATDQDIIVIIKLRWLQ